MSTRKTQRHEARMLRAGIFWVDQSGHASLTNGSLNGRRRGTLNKKAHLRLPLRLLREINR